MNFSCPNSKEKILLDVVYCDSSLFYYFISKSVAPLRVTVSRKKHQKTMFLASRIKQIAEGSTTDLSDVQQEPGWSRDTRIFQLNKMSRNIYHFLSPVIFPLLVTFFKHCEIAAAIPSRL